MKTLFFDDSVYGHTDISVNMDPNKPFWISDVYLLYQINLVEVKHDFHKKNKQTKTKT